MFVLNHTTSRSLPVVCAYEPFARMGEQRRLLSIKGNWRFPLDASTRSPLTAIFIIIMLILLLSDYLDHWASYVTEACCAVRLASLYWIMERSERAMKKKTRPVLMLAGSLLFLSSSRVLVPVSPKDGCSTTEFSSCLLALWTSTASCFRHKLVIMTLYVKGFKIDRQRIANILGVTRTDDPRVEAGISVVVKRLNRDAYLRIVTGYEPRCSDGMRHVALIIALHIDDDEERLREMELGPLDESISIALPHTLVGPDVWELRT